MQFVKINFFYIFCNLCDSRKGVRRQYTVTHITKKNKKHAKSINLDIHTNMMKKYLSLEFYNIQ